MLSHGRRYNRLSPNTAGILGFLHDSTFCPSPKFIYNSVDEEIRTYQYIDDVLIGGPDTDKVRNMRNIQNYIIEHLEGVGLKIPENKIQCPASEEKILGREVFFVSLLRY